MNISLTTLAVVLSTMLFQFSCEKVTSVVDQNFQKSYLIPSAVGNTWIYTDSNQTHFDTVSVTGVYNNQGYTWWKLENNSFAMVNCYNKFGVRNDTLFNTSTPKGGSEQIGLLFIPPSDSTVEFVRIEGCIGNTIMVTAYYTTYTVPAGTFNNYIAYISQGWREHDSLVIVPGIGIVARILVVKDFPGLPGYTVKSFLKSYVLHKQGCDD
ncbi:MAG: hypothetical protein Q8K98_08875 [Bacteroidota bacterium]|nr:hypothetical protein [Bacteroidota bacterium]